MPQINCHIPITLRITGELTDEELGRLGDALARTLVERIAFAERTVASRHAGLLAGGDGEAVREEYDPAREAAAAYAVPSYQRTGAPTRVPLQAQSARSGRSWFIRKAINFHAAVGDYLLYIEQLQRSRTLAEKDLYFDLLDEARWVSAWLVQVNRAVRTQDLHPVLYQRAAELSRVRPNEILAYGYAFFEINRRQLIAIDQDHIVAREIPDMSRNATHVTADGDDLSLSPGGMMLATTMVLPKIEVADVAVLDADMQLQVQLRELTFLVPVVPFKERFGISWSDYVQELGAQPVTLHLQPFTVRRRVHFLALRYLVGTAVNERIRTASTGPDSVHFVSLYLLNSSTLGQLPPAAQSRATSATNNTTRSLDDSQIEGHWEVDWKGSVVWAVATINADTVGMARYRPIARRLLPRLLDWLDKDPTELHWGRDLFHFLQVTFGQNIPETRPPGGTPFEYVLAELETRGQFDMLFDKVEEADHGALHQYVIRLSLATRYVTHPRVRRSYVRLSNRVLAKRSNTYRVAEGEIWLGGESKDTVRIRQVFGEVDDTYITERKARRLKPSRVPAFREALEIESQALVKRILRGEDTNRYTEEDFARAVVGAAVQRIRLSNDDFEKVTIQRSMRLLRLEASTEQALPRFYITFEFVERVGDEPWQSVSNPIREIDDEFEARLTYFQLARAGKFYEGMLIGMTAAGAIFLLAVAWEAGLIAALVEAAGGTTTVLLSIGISELIYVIRVIFGNARWSIWGLLEAAVDGYLFALGFRGAGFLGTRVAQFIGKETLTELIGGWIARRLVTGIVGGAVTGALTTFSHDLIRIATGEGGWSGIGTYVRNMGWGALLGTAFELGSPALQGLVRAAAGDTLKTLGQVVEQVRAEGISGVRWTALTSEALGNLNARLSVVIGDVAANGFVKAMGERLALVAEQIGGEYRQSIFRQVLELTPGAMSGEAAAGLEALLKLPRAELSNEAALAVLNRLNPQQLRTFLEALNGLDNATIAALTRTPHLDLVAGNPQAFQIIRSHPELLQAIGAVPRENAELFLQAIRTLPDRAFGSGVGAYSPNFFRNLAQSPQSMRFLIDANYDTFSALYRAARYDFARFEETLAALEEIRQRLPVDQRAAEFRRFLDRLVQEDPTALQELRNAVNTRRAAQGARPVRSYSAAELDEIVRTTPDIREIRRLAGQLDNSTAGSLFERWGNRYVFGRQVGVQRTRLVVRVQDNPHIDLPQDRISDVYIQPDGAIWDAKLYRRGQLIDREQLADYRAMEEAGYVITPNGQRVPVREINYLFGDRAAAVANRSTVQVEGGAEAWYIDDHGVLQHLD